MTLKYGFLFNVDIKILVFKAWWVNPKSTLFQRWILSMNQRWQIDVEAMWISHWPTWRRYFNIYHCWINVECLLGYIFNNYQIFSQQNDKALWIHVKCTLKWFNQSKLLLLMTSLKQISYERLFLAADFYWLTVKFCTF